MNTNEDLTLIDGGIDDNEESVSTKTIFDILIKNLDKINEQLSNNDQGEENE